MSCWFEDSALTGFIFLQTPRTMRSGQQWSTVTNSVTVGQFLALRGDVQDLQQKVTACHRMLKHLVGGLLTGPNDDEELLTRPLTSVEAVDNLQQQLTLPAVRKRAVSSVLSIKQTLILGIICNEVILSPL